MELAWQGSLFEPPPTGGPPGREPSFAGLRRDHLDDRSWVDVVPGWLPEHAALFGELLQDAPWSRRTRRMWDADVLEPRLVAVYDGPLPDSLERLRLAVSARYAVTFDSCLVNLYRDGSDAVAWHGDTVRKVLRDPLVVTVSLGSRRRFLVRRAAGGPVLKRYAPGEGDLMVMGGSMQHDYVHSVPRDAHASGARMSVTMRHSAPSGS